MDEEKEERKQQEDNVYEGPVGGPDDQPFDLPTRPGMQEEVRRIMNAPEQCPPCSGARRRLLSGCNCA